MPPPAATQAAARLWTARVALSTPPFPARLRYLTRVCSWLKIATRHLIDAIHARTCTGIKNGHNSVTVQNRTHVYMNFFDHKGLGNHLLQLCPKVVKHPVYMYLQLWRNNTWRWICSLCTCVTVILKCACFYSTTAPSHTYWKLTFSTWNLVSKIPDVKTRHLRISCKYKA